MRGWGLPRPANYIYGGTTMKISEMTNDQATQALIRLSGPFASICDDDEMMAILDEVQKMRDSKGVPVIKAIAKILPKFIAFGLVKHKGDLYEIVGALLSEPKNKVGGLNVAQTIQAVKDSYDDVLASFFQRSAPVTMNSAE